MDSLLVETSTNENSSNTTDDLTSEPKETSSNRPLDEDNKNFKIPLRKDDDNKQVTIILLQLVYYYM